MTRDNSDIKAKVAVREKAVQMMQGRPIRVLDLYAGSRVMKKLVWDDVAEAYLGIDKRGGTSDVWRGHNMRILKLAMSQDDWTVFDLDAYGNPWELATEVCRLRGPGTFAMALTCGLARSLRSTNTSRFIKKVTGLHGITEPRLLRRWYDEIVRWVIQDWQRLGVTAQAAHRARSRANQDVYYYAIKLNKVQSAKCKVQKK